MAIRIAFSVLSVILVCGSDAGEAPRFQESDALRNYDAAYGAIDAKGRPTTATALLQAYDENEVSADQAFRGQRVLVSGAITSIGADVTRTPYVTLAAGDRFSAVQAFFERDKDEGTLATLRRGQYVSISCVVAGKSINVVLQSCQM